MVFYYMILWEWSDFRERTHLRNRSILRESHISRNWNHLPCCMPKQHLYIFYLTWKIMKTGESIQNKRCSLCLKRSSTKKVILHVLVVLPNALFAFFSEIARFLILFAGEQVSVLKLKTQIDLKFIDSVFFMFFDKWMKNNLVFVFDGFFHY